MRSKTLLIGVIGVVIGVMLFGLGPPAQAEDSGENHVVTIYFGGTGLPDTWWKAEKPLPAFWWNKGVSRFQKPHLLALLHYYQDVEDETQFKHFVNGVGAWPQCLGGC